jgi:ketosteroid isomerase-like protein
MAEQNLTVVERAIAAFNAHDVEAFATLTTPDFEWFPSMSPVEGESFVGHDGVRRYFERLGDAWEYFRVSPEAFREGPDLVLVLGRLEGRGRSSGAAVDASLGMAFDLRDGTISRIRGFLDHAQALGEVGLEP